jgi:hypothetical protein
MQARSSRLQRRIGALAYLQWIADSLLSTPDYDAGERVAQRIIHGSEPKFAAHLFKNRRQRFDQIAIE